MGQHGFCKSKELRFLPIKKKKKRVGKYLLFRLNQYFDILFANTRPNINFIYSKFNQNFLTTYYHSYVFISRN
jgi:hypothetical protein